MPEGLATFSGNCRPGKFFTGPVGLRPNMWIAESTLTRYPPSPPRMTADKATQSERSALTQGAQTENDLGHLWGPRFFPTMALLRNGPAAR